MYYYIKRKRYKKVENAQRERDLQFSFIFFFVIKREMREMRSFLGGGGFFFWKEPLALLSSSFLLSSLSLSLEREREAKKIEKEHTA